MAYHFYWAPAHLGLRERSANWKWEHSFQKMNGDERMLNGFFDIAFSIAPDSIIHDWFAQPLGIDDHGPFKSYGLLELNERYGWGEANITQRDATFISETSIIHVELKLSSPSSINQILKYAYLVLVEEQYSRPRQNSGLLFIIPPNKLTKIEEIIERWGKIKDDSLIFDTHIRSLNRPIREKIVSASERFREITNDLRLSWITWPDLYDLGAARMVALDKDDPGQQTLHRLLDGFLAQLQTHRNTGIIS